MIKKLFIPCTLKKEISLDAPSLKEIQSYGPKIAIFTTAQHLTHLDKIKAQIEASSLKVVAIGQVLGCSSDILTEFEDAADSFLYIGSGRFHPLNIAFKTKRPVLIYNPYSKKLDFISDEEKKKYEKKRRGAILRAADAKTFGILVSSKRGQEKLSLAKKIKETLRSKGKGAFIFYGGEISPERLTGFFGIDSWINTACPRIIEDYFDKPMINPDELKSTISLF